jgi:hypothetical protein
MMKNLAALLIILIATAALTQLVVTPPIFVQPSGGGMGPGTIVLSPASGTPLRGQSVTFNANTSSNVASVEFRMGGYWLGTVTSPPFTLTWNTGWAYDGIAHVQAIARDGFGNTLATADNSYQINNFGNTFNLASPNLDFTQSGTITLNMSVTDTHEATDTWVVQIDGVLYFSKIIAPPPTSISIPIDTTTLINGQHEIYIVSVYESAANIQNDSVQYHRMITVNNGHTLLGVAPNLEYSYIQPSGTVNVGCQQIFTDNTTGSCSSPAYSSSDSTIATVNSSGLVTATTNEGFVTITVSDGKSGLSYVWVRNTTGIPHFSGSGSILTSYTPGSSLFVTSPFYTQPQIIQNDNGNSIGGPAPAELHRAGVNTLQDQIYDGGYTYNNPPGIAGSYSAWQSQFDSIWIPYWTWTANNNFHVMGLGDQIARGIGQEGWFAMNWPSSNLALAHAMQVFANRLGLCYQSRYRSCGRASTCCRWLRRLFSANSMRSQCLHRDVA